MSELPVNLSSTGPPMTALPPEDPAAVAAVAAALNASEGDRRSLVAAIVAQQPDLLVGWAALGALARDDVEAYACYRVGYHRGLDRMRASGWRGTGYLPASVPSNRGFLDSLAGLAATAVALGEVDEAERCRHFLVQLDPETYSL
ncbi:MAG: DUF3151 family protein [Actinomycetota bacterium]